MGCSYELIDLNPDKAAVAERLGVSFRLPADARPDADLVVHASGHPQGLVTALALAGFEATVVELSWFGAGPVELPLGEAFHSRRLTLKSSQVSAIAAAQRGRWSHERRARLGFELLAEPDLDVLITGESRFEELPEVLQRLTKAPGRTLCHRISYS